MQSTPHIPRRRAAPLLLLPLLLIAPGATVAAVDVPIANPGFEADRLSPGGIRTTITGWRTSPGGGDGIFRPTASDYPGGIPEGRNVAYVNLPGNIVRQTLTTPLRADTTYALSVSVGWNENDRFAGYIVQLRAGGTILAEDRSSLRPAQGTWVRTTVRYTSGASDPELGAPLEIRLLSPGVQANYDDVRLTAEGAERRIPCHDLTVPTDEGLCSASIDAAAFDPEGRLVIVAADPAGPYPPGSNVVTFTVDQSGVLDRCEVTVTVEDRAAPVVECNAPETITPPETPLSLTATASDNCGVASVAVADAECWRTNGAGKRVEAPGACTVSLAGDSLTILRSGGVGQRLAWEATATDGAGNSITRGCATAVVGRRGGRGR